MCVTTRYSRAVMPAHLSKDCGQIRSSTASGRPSLRLGRKRGEKSQAIGRSRGGRTTKIHALTDTLCRPIAFLLTGGQVADCTAASSLFERLPTCRILHADKGYDTNHIRRSVEAKGTMPNIPPKANWVWKNCFSPYLSASVSALCWPMPATAFGLRSGRG